MWLPCTPALRHVPCASLDVVAHLSDSPSLPLPSPCALFRSWCHARAPEQRHHGCRHQAPVLPLLPLLQPSCVCTECCYVSNSSRHPTCAHFPVTTAAVSPSPLEQPLVFRLCVWPGQLGLPPVDLSSPTHVRRSLDAPRRFFDAVDDHSRWSREPGRSPTLLSRGRRRWTTRGSRRFSRGLSEEPVTHLSSAMKDRSASI